MSSHSIYFESTALRDAIAAARAHLIILGLYIVLVVDISEFSVPLFEPFWTGPAPKSLIGWL